MADRTRASARRRSAGHGERRDRAERRADPAPRPARSRPAPGAPVIEAAVIADDLTGAADCGMAFAAAGLATFVSFADAPAPAGVQVLSVDTDSRRQPEREAVRRARAAAERAVAGGVRALYRKIDSTLRGHVGPELAETLRAVAAAARGAAPVGLLAPAFPAMGRTTVGGDVLVKGVLLERTEVWRDARMSVPARPAELLVRAGLRARGRRGSAASWSATPRPGRRRSCSTPRPRTTSPRSRGPAHASIARSSGAARPASPATSRRRSG